MEPLIYVGVVLLCLVLSGFFSASETALLRLRSHEVDEDVKEARGPAAVAVRDLLQSTSRLLVTILLGNNVVNILGSSVAAALAIHYLGARYGILASTAVMTVLVLVFCEILPKALAAQHPRAISYTVGLPLYLFHAVLRPLHLLFDRIIEPVVRRIAGGPGMEPQSAEEILRLARLARTGSGDGTPMAIIGATAEAAERTVEEIMVPRTEMVAFPVDTAPNTLLENMLEERFTRVPVYQDSVDQILGVVHLKDLIKLVRSDGGSLHGISKPVLRVPERKPILRLLQDMQRAFVHLAIVKDEFGVTRGLLTQEDILEEIVGEIRDEFDRDELLAIRALQDGSYQALGRVKVMDFNRESGWEVPAEPGDTLSGLVFNLIGHAPSKGEVVTVPGYELQVADISGTRITRVHLRQAEAEESEENGLRLLRDQ